MKKSLLLLLAAVFLCLTAGAATKWEFQKTLWTRFSVPHGVTVAPDGKIWMCVNSNSYDTLGTITRMTSLIVLNQDGSFFQKLQTVTTGAVTDTLSYAKNNGRGIATMKNGDILACMAGVLLRINPTTLQGVARYTNAISPTAPGETNDGEIIVGPVLNGNPIRLFSSSLALLGNVVDSTYQIARTMAVSADGNDVYLGSTTGPGVIKYHSDNGTLGPYAVADTVLKGIATESMCWRKGNLWLSSRDAVASLGLSKWTWYEYDPTTKAILDSITWCADSALGGNNKYCTPRGIAFSLGGDTAYVMGSDGNQLQMFTKVLVSVEPVNNAIPSGYTLTQNYPNPFNPSTEIQFSIPKAGFTTLKVYDMLGKEVATLVNDQLAPGTFKARLDGSGLASGTYVYRLVSGTSVITKKMMLLK